MKSKFRLIIDKSTVELAKTHANKQGLSLSLLVENYLKSVIENDELVSNQHVLSPVNKKFKT